MGFSLFDRIDGELHRQPELIEYAWKQREIENYIISDKQVLIDWVLAEGNEQTGGPLFASLWRTTIEETITEIESALITLGRGSPWSTDIKVTDDFLDRLFETFFEKLRLPNLMQKTNYHTLVEYVPAGQIDPEVIEVLDAILKIAQRAVPLGGS